MMDEWRLIYDRFEPDEEGVREALCVLGNGYFATRGAAAEADAGGCHYPGTYLAGGYNRLKTEIAGRIVENEDLVNLPNWLPLTFRIDGGTWFDVRKVEILDYRQELDIRQGVLHRSIHFRDVEGRETRFTSRRLVHMASPHLAAQETVIKAENWAGRIEVRSALDGRVVNGGVARYQGLNNRHLEPLATSLHDDRILLLEVETSQSHLRIAEAALTRVFRGGEALEVGRHVERRSGYVGETQALEVALGQTVSIEKVAALYSSRDHAIADPGLEAVKAVRAAGRFETLLHSHRRAWDLLWRRFDAEIVHQDHVDEDLQTRQILRLHAFHLLQTASPHTIDLDVGIPARGLHGEAYRGHIFWDELFIFPFLNLRLPEVTRSLLRYRYRRLPEARANARKAGFEGAMFPWQSASNGREETQVVHLNPRSGRWLPDNSHLQRHVNAAIVYNIWHYFQATGDLEFMAFYGAEMILEIARFWASIVTYNPRIDRYEILKVVGPDEYHDSYPDAGEPGLDNNAYTNVMAVWCLCRALDVLNHLPQDRHAELCETLQFTAEEFALWRDISHKMRLVFHDDGIISQFEGYDRLEELDWAGYRKRYGDIQRLDRILEAEGDTPNRYKASKQADVLMLFYLFSADELKELFDQLDYAFAYETIPTNIDYYLERTSHGSTLSRVVHGWVLSRSDRTRSWRLLRESLQSDVADIQGGTTAEGVHLGAMAGSVNVIERVLTGIETRGETLTLNPCLPEDLRQLKLKLRYRSNTVEVTIRRDRVEIRTVEAPTSPIKVACCCQCFTMKPGDRQVISL